MTVDECDFSTAGEHIAMMVLNNNPTFDSHHQSEHFVVRATRKHYVSREQFVQTHRHRPKIDGTIICVVFISRDAWCKMHCLYYGRAMWRTILRKRRDYVG